MNKNMRRGLRLLFTALIMVMLCGMASSAASAKTVAKIGSKKYSSLEDAISSVKKGQTIVLQSDVKYTKKLTISKSTSKSFTINLNKKTITFGKNAYLYLKKGTVTIRNGKIKNSNKDGYVIKTGKNGTLKIKSGTYTGLIETKGTTKITGGTFKSKRTGSIYDYDSWDSSSQGTLIYNTGTMTISGGKFNYGFSGMLVNGGKLTIKGGTFQCSDSIISNVEKATLKISGGKFENSGSSWYLISNMGKITISGGSFTGCCMDALIESLDHGSLTIKGGTFTGLKNEYYGGLYTPPFTKHPYCTEKVTGGTYNGKSLVSWCKSTYGNDYSSEGYILSDY